MVTMFQHCRRCGIAGGVALQAVQRSIASGAALHAVRHCRLCGVAGGERVPPAGQCLKSGTILKQGLNHLDKLVRSAGLCLRFK